MKSKFLLSIMAVLAVAFSFTSCGGGSGTKGVGNVSSSTGRAYNDVTNGGFEVKPFVEQETGPGLIYIEGGAFNKGATEQDINYSWDAKQRRHTIKSFYMDITEVRNIDYLEYMHWVKHVFGASKDNMYESVLPDTTVWRRRLGYNEPYVENYLRHPAYYTYPVVGVSWEKARKYCIWRTDRVNEEILVREGVLKYDTTVIGGKASFNTDVYLAGQFQWQNVQGDKGGVPDLRGGTRQVKMEDGILLPKYRLPTEAEWEYAALALKGNSANSPERIWSYRLYPWNGHYLRKNRGPKYGKFMANFKRGRGDMMGVAGALNDNGSITVPVDSYFPNDFGLYCMAGNVNEWVLDTYRKNNTDDLEDFNPFRGNVFQKKQKDGKKYKLDDVTGHILYEDVSAEDCAKTYNYSKAYNINYKDGDVASSVPDDNSIYGNTSFTSVDTLNNSYRMYNANQTGKERAMSTLVSDNTKIYKGGGWRDNAYWLSPGNKRYLDKDLCSDDLGFRCAMDRMGSPRGDK